MRVASLSKTTVIPRERTKAVESQLDAKEIEKRNERRKQGGKERMTDGERAHG
jgi:hypothetical protein